MPLSRNYIKLKQQLDGSLEGWKIVRYTKFSHLLNMNLKNKLTNGKCLHCICGHRTGKYQKIKLKKNKTDKPDNLDKICNEVFEENKKNIETNIKNSLTDSYDESSLLPMAKEGCDFYILVGKTCCKYFDMSENEIKNSFKENIKYKEELRNPIIKKKMSCDPKILLKNHEVFDFGKYKGMSIYQVNTLKGGSYYLETVCRWNVSPDTIEAIEELLYQSL